MDLHQPKLFHLLQSCKRPRAAAGVLLSILVCALPPVFASEEADAEYHLSVRPSICVSYDSAAPCIMSMQVTWASTRAGDFCLQEARLEVAPQDPLRCWDDARSGDIKVQYSDTSDVQYRLVDEVSRHVLAEAEVVVINRDLRDSRKRRRHVWSIL